MTLQQLDELMEDTRKLPRAQDKVALHMTIATIEIARQLVILNERLGQDSGNQSKFGKSKGSAR
jgi:hypothetical protein